VLIEETIVKAVNFFRGTPDGAGTLVVNSARDPEYLLKFLPEHMLAKLARLVVVEAMGPSRVPLVLAAVLTVVTGPPTRSAFCVWATSLPAW